MTTDQHPSMHHFESKEDFREFVDELAANKAEAIEECGAYEIATDVIAQIEDRTTEIQVGGGSVPDNDDINAQSVR